MNIKGVPVNSLALGALPTGQGRITLRSSEFLQSYTYCFDLGDIFVTHIVQVGTTHAQLGLVSVSFVISTF